MDSSEKDHPVSTPLILWVIQFLCFLCLYLFFHRRLTWSFLWSLFWLIQISVCISRVFIATHFPHQVILGVFGGKYDHLPWVVSLETFRVICFMSSDYPGSQYPSLRWLCQASATKRCPRSASSSHTSQILRVHNGTVSCDGINT